MSFVLQFLSSINKNNLSRSIYGAQRQKSSLIHSRPLFFGTLYPIIRPISVKINGKDHPSTKYGADHSGINTV